MRGPDQNLTEGCCQSSDVVQRESEIKLLVELFIFCSVCVCVCVFYDTDVCTLKAMVEWNYTQNSLCVLPQ